MEPEHLDILYEDNHLLVVNKPTGIATQGALPGEPSLAQVAKQYIKWRYAKPGNVYLGVVSRLDSRVSGVVVFARTSKAAARLTASFANRETVKIYWAVTERRPDPPAGQCLHWLWHDDEAHRVRVARGQSTGAKEARLSYRVLQTVDNATLVEVVLETGRKHQIRVQLAESGWPILGDTKYGARQPWPAGIALHARRLDLNHPVRDTPLTLVAPVPTCWPRWVPRS